MNKEQFEQLLEEVTARLERDVQHDNSFHKPSAFEDRVRETLDAAIRANGFGSLVEPKAQAFPDVVAGEFGVEVKATESDSWRCIANSVSESTRNPRVRHIYVIYGKMGGVPQVQWASYGDAIVHVRTSHVPRFEIEINSDRSLFRQIGISYEDFRTKEMHEKMQYIREYARARLKPGERLWWLEDQPDDEQAHTLPINVRIYMELSQEEKRQFRAEAALLCPQIVGGSRQRRKYVDAVTYLMTYRGVLCPQARDLFSAGSVALRANEARGGNYLLRALLDIQDEMREAARSLEPALFMEYWGQNVQPSERLTHWLHLADNLAPDWLPSEHLFLEEQENSFRLF